jgi:hypothetical protein
MAHLIIMVSCQVLPCVMQVQGGRASQGSLHQHRQLCSTQPSQLYITTGSQVAEAAIQQAGITRLQLIPDLQGSNSSTSQTTFNSSLCLVLYNTVWFEPGATSGRRC